MSLSQLPNEILLKMIESIPVVSDSHRANRTLFNLSICSHRLRKATEPTLYSSFLETTPTSLLSFLRTILKNPLLAQYVKTYEGLDTRTIHQEATLHYPLAPNTVSQDAYDEELETLIHAAIQKADLGMKREDLWKEDKEGYVNAEWDTATALALCILPHLQTFKVTYSQSRLHVPDDLSSLASEAFRLPWMNIALQRRYMPLTASTSIYPAANLDGRHMIEMMMGYAPYLRHDLVDPILSTTTFTLHFNVHPTSLQRLTVNYLPHFVWDFDILDNAILAQTQELELIQTAGFMVSYANLFERFPRLQRLCMIACKGIPLRAADVLSQAIQHLQPHLLDLTLHGQSKNDGIRHPSNSLAGFTVLQHLDITAQHLDLYYPAAQIPGDDYIAPYWDHRTLQMVFSHPVAPYAEVLPSGLKTLKLRWCDKFTVQKARELVRNQMEGGGERRLEKLFLEFWSTKKRDEAADGIAALFEECAYAEIDVSFDSAYLSRRDVRARGFA